MTTDASNRAEIETLHGLSPDRALDALLATLHSTPEPDFDLIMEVGSGPLEALFQQGHEAPLWTRIERLARNDLRFRRALSTTWAYDSPMLARRDALLDELGERRAVSVRFVAEPHTFDDASGFAWRALELDGVAEGSGLAQTLRAIADVIDRANATR